MPLQSFDQKLHLATRAVNGEVQREVNSALARCWPGEELSLQRLRAHRVGATTWYRHPVSGALVVQVDEFAESRRKIVEKSKGHGRASKRYVVDPPRKVWTVYYPHGPEGERITTYRAVYCPYERGTPSRREVAISHVGSVVRFAEPRLARDASKSAPYIHAGQDRQRAIARKAERAHKWVLRSSEMAHVDGIAGCPPLESPPKEREDLGGAGTSANGASSRYVRGAKRETIDYRPPWIEDVSYQRVTEEELRLPGRLANQRVNHPTGGYTTVQQQAPGTYRVVRHTPSGSRVWQKNVTGYDAVASLGAETVAREVSSIGYTPSDREVRARIARRDRAREFRDEVLVETHPAARAAYAAWEEQVLLRAALDPLLKDLRCILLRLDGAVESLESEIRLMAQAGAGALVQGANQQFYEACHAAVEQLGDKWPQSGIPIIASLYARASAATTQETKLQFGSESFVSTCWAAVKKSLERSLPSASERQFELLEAVCGSFYESLLKVHAQASRSVDNLIGNSPLTVEGAGGKGSVECWQIPNSFAVFSKTIHYMLFSSRCERVATKTVVSALAEAESDWDASDPEARGTRIVAVIKEVRRQIRSAVYTSAARYLEDQAACAKADGASLRLRESFEYAKSICSLSRSSPTAAGWSY